MQDNDSLHHAILQLLLLPRRVLCRVACQRGAARALRRSLFRYSSVQQTVPVGTDPHPLDQEQHSDTRTLRARAISKASTLMKAGHKIRAVRTLLQDALLLNVTDEVVSQLIELHPASTAALPIPDNEWTSLYLKEQYSQRFYDKGAAPGPSGWTGAMIIPLLENVVCRKALAIVFTQIINGSIPNGMLNQTLRAARLIPLSKPTPGVRPIAVGEIFMRVAASIVLRNIPLRSVFPSIQFGLGRSAGVESAVLTAQALLDKHLTDESVVLISTDIKNAFNSLSRTKMFDAVESCPLVHSLRRIVHWTHNGASPLLVYKETDVGRARAVTILSREGVQQGHPLGSLCFDLAIIQYM